MKHLILMMILLMISSCEQNPKEFVYKNEFLKFKTLKTLPNSKEGENGLLHYVLIDSTAFFSHDKKDFNRNLALFTLQENVKENKYNRNNTSSVFVYLSEDDYLKDHSKWLYHLSSKNGQARSDYDKSSPETDLTLSNIMITEKLFKNSDYNICEFTREWNYIESNHMLNNGNDDGGLFDYQLLKLKQEFYKKHNIPYEMRPEVDVYGDALCN